MGVTVRQKVKGRGQAWWVFIRTNGKLTSKRIGDRRAAEAVASELRVRLKAGELDLPSGEQKNTAPTLAEFAKEYIERYAKVQLKRNTWQSYEQILRDHVLPTLGSQRIDEVARRDIKNLLLSKSESYAPATVQNIQLLLSGIFSHAVEDELIPSHPALKMGRYIAKGDRRSKINPLGREQTRHLLATCKAQYPDHHAMLMTLFRTGVRLGELLGLAWDDIDFDEMRVVVNRSYSHGHFASPKSHKSRRIDMSDQLASTLQAHREKLACTFGRLPTTEIKLPRVPPFRAALVFPNKLGEPTDADNFRRRVFTPLLKAADLPHMRIHDVRHTFASMLLQNGESLHYVKEQMGHASITTTVDTYGHLVPGSNRRAVNRLDDPPPSEGGESLRVDSDGFADRPKLRLVRGTG